MWGQDKQEGKGPINNETEEGSEATAPANEGTGDISAFVGKGVEFKGTISYSGTVRIDGMLEGEIHTDGVLLVGEDATITRHRPHHKEERRLVAERIKLTS